jgi:hypothetical protein
MAICCSIHDSAHGFDALGIVDISIAATTGIVVTFGIGRKVIIVQNALFRRLQAVGFFVLVAEKVIAIVDRVDRVF